MGEAERKREAGRYELVITYGMLTYEFTFHGWDRSRLIALGMLEFAKAKLLRVDALIDLRAETQNQPLIIPGGSPATKGPLG
jgi:hypothetical protein